MDQLLSIISSCLPCLPNLSSPYVSINNQKYKIVKLLGEGGFSYVYLVLQKSTNAQYALKRIRCPFGSNDESFKNAMKEIKSYHRFSNSKTPYIIKSIDETIIQEPDGSRTIYILLPFFEKSLQDIINANVLHNKVMEEEDILRIFIGICRGLQVMHKFKQVSGKHTPNTNNDTNGSNGGDLEQEEDLLLPADDDDEDGLTSTNVNDGDLDNPGTTMNNMEMEELVPFAHRDIKPANVMLSAEGLPVLVDLGSTTKARIHIKNRQQALTLLDFASEHCTLPYRAPELFDVATSSTITEKTDIWSLGCLLYCCCFGYSPFEKMELEQGANLTVAITSGRFTIPNNHNYSPELLEMIKNCLQLESDKRPSIDELLEECLQLSRRQ